MIKGIPPSKKSTTRQPELNAPDTSAVSRKAADRFSSLLHEKKQSELEKFSQSKQKVNKSINKIENKLAKQIGQIKAHEEQQTSSSKQVMQERHIRPSTDKRSASFLAKQIVERSEHDDQPTSEKKETAVNKDLPQTLDAFDIASMIAQNQTPVQSTAAAQESAPPPPADLNKVVGEIAERILVSSPADNPSGVQEIHIHLKQSVLPNTEVRIYRHAGSLQVEFVTTSKDSQMLIEQKQSDIQKILGERLTNETVQVSVQDSRSTRGGQGEGRSRQQYINPELEDD